MTSSNLSRALVLALAAAGYLFATAPITVVVTDPSGVGFNDPTPAVPVGGNNGATIGEQRLNVLRYAAGIWSSKLDSPVPIRVRVHFESLTCTETGGIAGIGTPRAMFAWSSPFPEIVPNVWYTVALANKFVEKTLTPNDEEIELTFNPDLGEPDCSPSTTWYYGLDRQVPPHLISMVNVALHEIAHGLGFLHTEYDDGSWYQGRGDVYSQYVLDTSTGKSWNQMTDQERVKSRSNSGHVVWSGINVRKDAAKVLGLGTPVVRVMEPASIARDLPAAVAEFGAELAAAGVSAELALVSAVNAAGPAATDACSPLLNAGELSGRIALADRGTCPFIQKAANVQAAGAIGLVVVNNVDQYPTTVMSGTDPAVTIPAVHIALPDGNPLKAALAAGQRVSINLLLDPQGRRGADSSGRPYLYAPNPANYLSPVSHWDFSVFPYLLMEAEVFNEASHTLEPPEDLTLSLLRDIGWFSDWDGVPDGIDQCPGSDSYRTVQIQGCDTGVINTTFTTGCRVSDFYKPCAEDSSGNFAACVNAVSQELLKAKAIGPADPAKIQACAKRVP